MTPEFIVQLIQNFGFPVLVATYLLIRIEPVLRQLQETQAAQLELMRLFSDRFLGGAPHTDKSS